ncbi:MAG: hypothetical protein KME12_24680 [Trichocoleus desertorum ATA4-8-CV12]|jgi:hypothetical protein|nr:hypothetical protein [Trichocoleus desertorum ATA4-8-CV12]
MGSDCLPSKYTVSNVRVHQHLFNQKRFRLWQVLSLWIGISGSATCATAATAEIPEPSLKPTVNPVILQHPQLAQTDTSLGSAQDSVSLDVSLSRPTVETEILWSELTNAPSLSHQALVSQAFVNQARVAPPNAIQLSQLTELDEPPSEVELQLQPERSLEQILVDPELGNLRLQKPTSQPPANSAVPPEPSASESSPPSLETSQQATDPELGNLRLQESLESREEQLDPELGTLRIRQQPVQASRSQPTVYLQGRVDFFQSNNIFSGVEPINDSLIRTGLSLWAAPAIGPKTYFIGSINGNLIKYATQDDFDYNELRIGASIYQQLTPKMYGEVGLSNQQLFTAGGGDRFLNDNSIRLGLGRRDSLGRAVTLDSFYQLRYSFADPSDRSRVINTLGASLNYNPTVKVQTGVDYQYVLSSFTEQGREDNYHQLLARLSYDWSRNSRITVFGGFGFGNSSNRNINFDSSIVGVSLSVNLPLF